jgi:hypothetical protein
VDVGGCTANWLALAFSPRFRGGGGSLGLCPAVARWIEIDYTVTMGEELTRPMTVKVSWMGHPRLANV